MERIKVLAVDDDQAILDLVCRQLANSGIGADGAISAEEALGMMEQNLYGVVVADIHMPGMSGKDMVQQIKKRNPLAQIIMLTSDATIGSVVECLDCGAMDFFGKTESLTPLMEAVRNALNRAERWASLMGARKVAQTSTA